MHIIINNYNKCNKAKVCQLGNFLNHLWQNKGPKPDFNQFCYNKLQLMYTLGLLFRQR